MQYFKSPGLQSNLVKYPIPFNSHDLFYEYDCQTHNKSSLPSETGCNLYISNYLPIFW